MRKIRYILCGIYLLVVFSGCRKQDAKAGEIKTIPISAEVVDSILVGPSVYSDPDRFVWGASVIEGDDGKYHMFYSTWPCGDSIPPFRDSWVLYSKIAYAVSSHPDRDFQFQQIVLTGRTLNGDSTAWDAQMVHNPHIKKFNQKYYLYYIGSKDPGRQPPGSTGAGLNKRDRVQQSQKIGVIEFSTFEELLSGRFERPDTPLLSPRTRVKPDKIVNPSPAGTPPKPDNIIVVNPSVVRRSTDGKFLLYFKGNFYDPNWRGVHGVAIGDTPTGPFHAIDQFVFDIRTRDNKIASGEDPYVWYHKRKQKFYAVLKDFTGKITGTEPGLALLESKDGLQWIVPENSFFMKKEVVLSGGKVIKMNRLERPQLLIGEEGDPLVLYCAATLVPVHLRQDGTSFNVHIPLVVE